jgi:GTP-binding protein
MNFIDKVSIAIKAGDGGNGNVSFRQEKFVDRGGPDGGDGGNGGSVVMQASRNQNTLAAFRYQKELHASDGQAGGKRRKHGRSAQDLIVQVPVGTVISAEDGTVLVDLAQDGQKAVIARGGRGGFGNAHFVSSVRQAPKFAETGEAGQMLTAQLEIKMIADVGLVGLPNAGKSTLLATVSNARPEIANYPFTTLKPNLGVVDIDKDTSILVADIPGLIEGAAQGKGLGHEFLRHVERTKVLIHLIDAYVPDVVAAYKTIQAELAAYKVDLTDRPQIVALNKTDGLDADIVADLMAQLQPMLPEGSTVQAISAQSGAGVKPMLYAVKAALLAYKKRQTEAAANDEDAGLPVLTMADKSLVWRVSKSPEGTGFIVTGHKIEKFASRTNFDNEQGVERLRDIMRKMGIMHELRRQGVEAGQIISVSGFGSFEY